jgi:hypothetical protein
MFAELPGSISFRDPPEAGCGSAVHGDTFTAARQYLDTHAVRKKIRNPRVATMRDSE